MIEPIVSVLAGVVGVIVGGLAIRAGRKEQLADDVVAHDKIRGHIKGIAVDVADKRIEMAAEKRKWLDERDRQAIVIRFDTVDERFDRFEANVTGQFAAMHEAMENGLAERIARQVVDAVGKRDVVYDGAGGPQVPIRRRRRREP